MRIGNAICGKLRSRAGESLTEVLAALLVSALALTMLAAMISSSGRMIRESEDKMEAYIAADRDLMVRSSAAASSEGTAAVSFDRGADDATPDLISDEADSASIGVYYFENTQFGGGIISYKVK